jgi:hypothetical protein
MVLKIAASSKIRLVIYLSLPLYQHPTAIPESYSILIYCKHVYGMMLKHARTWLVDPESRGQLKDTPACTVRARRPLHLLKLKAELLVFGMTGGIVSLSITLSLRIRHYLE